MSLPVCPWCKEEPISEDHDDNGWFVGCINNDCEITPSFWGDNKEETEAEWRKCDDK